MPASAIFSAMIDPSPPMMVWFSMVITPYFDFAMASITAIDVFLYRGAKTSEVRWGQIPAISQYVLIFIAVTFTWLMGLMGYVRSGLRQHWHVYGIIRDNSVDAFTPTLGFATLVVSVTVLAFFLLIGFVFWLASLSDHKKEHA